MVRKILQDMKIVHKAAPKRVSKDIPVKTETEYNIPNFNLNNERVELKPKRRGSRRFIFAFLAILVLLYGIYSFINLFQSATIFINKKHQVFTLDNQEFKASKKVNDGIGFEIIVDESKALKDIALTESDNVSIHSKGTVALYNKYSTAPQSILKNTFLEDSTGRAYRLDKNVSIPGYKLEDGNPVPGKVIASVTAFLSGSEYDISSGRLEFTAFKNTNKFGKLYGEINTPISGGAEGLVYKLGGEDLASIDKYAKEVIQNDLLKKMNTLVPKGYILYPNASEFSYKINNNLLSKTSDAKVEINTTMSSIIFNKKDISGRVLKSLLPNLNSEELTKVELRDLSELSFKFADSSQQISKDLQSFIFYFSGNVEASWMLDIQSIKSSLVGASKDSIPQILSNDDSISSARVQIFPIWQLYIPTDASKLKVIEEN